MGVSSRQVGKWRAFWEPPPPLGVRSASGRALSAAIIAGLFAYVPVPGIRGALVGLFPGIARRSGRTVVQGLICGFSADLFLWMLWTALFVWEPRDSYNLALSLLPPTHMVVTHVGCATPNWAQFGAGLVVWLGMMFGLWLYLWRPHVSYERRPLSVVGGMAFGAAVAALLWTVAPMGQWWHRGAQPFGDLPLIPFFIVYLSSVPLCGVVFVLLVTTGGRSGAEP